MAINPFAPAEQATGLDELLNPKLAILKALTSAQGPSISPAATMPIPSGGGNNVFGGNQDYWRARQAQSNSIDSAFQARGRQMNSGSNSLAADVMSENPLVGLAGEQLATAQGARASLIPGANEILMERKGKPLESIDDTVGNASFQRLYSRNPEAAKTAYQSMTGRSYDDDYTSKAKLTSEIAAFPRKTIMSMIGSGKLRQRGHGGMGQWEQLEETTDDLGNRKQEWKPANNTTMDMLMRSGGASGVGLTDYTNKNPLAQEHLLRVSRGEDPAQVEADITSRIQAAKTGMGTPEAGAAPQANPNQVEGLIPSIQKRFTSTPQEYASNSIDEGYDARARQLAGRGKLATIMSNLGTRFTGGELQNEPNLSSGPVTDESMYNELRLRQGQGPVDLTTLEAMRNGLMPRSEVIKGGSVDIFGRPSSNRPLDPAALRAAVAEMVNRNLSLQ